MTFFKNKETGDIRTGRVILLFFIAIGFLLFFLYVVSPLMKPWWAGQSGKAELAQAEQNRQIAIKEAEARFESAKLDAMAEIERARGVSEANQIIAGGLKNNEEYLRYLWIQQLKQGDTIYVPTEANLPILEARDKR